MKTLHVLGAWLLLLALGSGTLIACGGDDDGDASPTTEDSGADNGDDANGGGDGDSESEDSGDGDSESEDSGDGGSDGEDNGDLNFGAGTAVVTIGDTTYEFDLTASGAVCQVLFDLILADGPGIDGADTRVSMEIPPADWDSYDDERYDPPKIEVSDDEAGIHWQAGPDRVREIPEGMSQVDSYEIDGSEASGTATFIDLNKLGITGDGEVVTEQGSFEVACTEE